MNYEQWHAIVTDGDTLAPYTEWIANTNLHDLWNSRVRVGDPRWDSCGGDREVFTRTVYDWLDRNLDAFLRAVYASGFEDRGWRDLDATSVIDENTIALTPNNPGYFRNRCAEDVVVCGGDGDRALSIKDAIVGTLRGRVRKTFTMPAVWGDIVNNRVSPNLVLTFNKSCKLVSVFSPTIYRYLLERARRHTSGDRVLFATASWGVPVVATDTPPWNTVGIVDVQRGVLDACQRIHSERRARHSLQTYHTPSETMNNRVPGLWDVIMSCPPYWDLEVYGGSDQQSTDLYTTYESWLENYWRRTVEASMHMLAPGGVIAFTMGRYVRYKWCAYDMTRIATECGLEVVDTVRILPRRKTPKLHATSTEKWEICTYLRRAE